MSGLSSMNFMNGMVQGAQFAQGLQQAEDQRQERKEIGTLRKLAEQRQAQSHTLQMQNAQQEQQLRGMQIDKFNEAESERMNKAMAWSLYNAKSMPKDYQDLIATHPNANAQRLISDEYGKALDTLEAAATGKIDYRHPDVGKAFDLVNPEIQLGATQGRKVRTARLYPGKTPGTVMVGLHVDGDPDERPLTVNRSSDPHDAVKEVSIEQLIQRVQTAQQYRHMLLSPEGRDWFIKTTIGPELAQQNLQQQKMDLAKQELDITKEKLNQKGRENGPKPSALQKEIDYLKTLGMTTEQALNYRNKRTGDVAHDARLLAMNISKGGMVPMEDSVDEKGNKIPGAVSQALAAIKQIDAGLGETTEPKPGKTKAIGRFQVEEH